MKIDLAYAEEPICHPDDHDWEYDGGDSSVGINGGWVCKTCGAQHDGEAPSDNDYVDWP